MYWPTVAKPPAFQLGTSLRADARIGRCPSQRTHCDARDQDPREGRHHMAALADAERVGLVTRNAAAARPPTGESTELTTWSSDDLRCSSQRLRGARLGSGSGFSQRPASDADECFFERRGFFLASVPSTERAHAVGVRPPLAWPSPLARNRRGGSATKRQRLCVPTGQYSARVLPGRGRSDHAAGPAAVKLVGMGESHSKKMSEENGDMSGRLAGMFTRDCSSRCSGNKSN